VGPPARSHEGACTAPRVPVWRRFFEKVLLTKQRNFPAEKIPFQNADDPFRARFQIKISRFRNRQINKAIFWLTGNEFRVIIEWKIARRHESLLASETTGSLIISQKKHTVYQ